MLDNFPLGRKNELDALFSICVDLLYGFSYWLVPQSIPYFMLCRCHGTLGVSNSNFTDTYILA